MGWDKGRYYTRSKKVNGRVVREYVEAGFIGEAAALLDEDIRQMREAARKALRQEEARALDAPIQELNERADVLARAALVAAGSHQHKRGEWRKKRVHPCQGE